MLPSALRRVWLPWLLLTVPTLLVGVAVLWLLHNDRQRLEAARTDTLSRANQAARAQTQLASDNIELLVAEIRDGLIRELSETPESDLDPLLRNWPGTNPLVAQTFLWRSPNDELAWPDATNAEHRAFLQRHAALFDGTEPGLPREAEFVKLDAVSRTPVVSKLARPLSPVASSPAPTPSPSPTPSGAAPTELAKGSLAKETDVAFAKATEDKKKSEAEVVPQVAIQLQEDKPAELEVQQASQAPQNHGQTAEPITFNSTVALNQELRRDAYNTNRLSAAEAKRAGNLSTEGNQAELAAGNSAPANYKAGLVADSKSRAASERSRGQTSSSSSFPTVAATAPRSSSPLKYDKETAPSNAGKKPAVETLAQMPASKTQPFAADDSKQDETPKQLVGEAKDAEVREKMARAESAKTDSRSLAAERQAVAQATAAPLPGFIDTGIGGATTDEAESDRRLSENKTAQTSGARSMEANHPATTSAAPLDAPSAAPAAAILGSENSLRALEDYTAARSGWITRRLNGQTYFLGWWQPRAGAPVRGVELNLPAVLERVQALVPNGLSGERYRLLGPTEAARDADVVVPLASTLPGWTLAAWFAPIEYADSFNGSGFFAVAVLLVVVFVGAVIAGGAMFFRQAAEAAHDAALKTNFVSNVSHEMKTPLTTIRMYAEMLADERVTDPEKRRRYFATIGRETTRLARLVNNALDFGRLEAGRKDYRAENIVLGPWLTRLTETHAPRLAEAGMKLSAQTGDTARIARLDADSLEQMTLNLLDNAVKYATAGGEVELRLEAIGGRPALIVADRGPGVPAAHRERIFERFHRVDETLTAKTQGAGLGLTIARRLARDQGGDLHYREREGGGAEFVLTLPASETANETSEATA